MISKITFTTVYVLDQEKALDFYTNKLGFKIHTDASMGAGGRWLTVCPPQQPDVEITLFPVLEGAMFDKEAVDALTLLIKKGSLGQGGFECDDIFATYEEMTAKGVEFLQKPKQEFYGLAAVFKDDSGNWFSLTQKQ